MSTTRARMMGVVRSLRERSSPSCSERARAYLFQSADHQAVEMTREIRAETETICAVLLFVELDPPPVKLGHDGTCKFSDEVWAFVRPPPRLPPPHRIRSHLSASRWV